LTDPDSSDDEGRAAVAQAFRGRVWEAVRSPHANHVIQKVVETLRPNAFQFVVDELRESLSQVARHRFGCRIVQRLVEHGLPEQVGDLVEELIVEFPMLSRHSYGTFVIQNLLEHASEEHRRRLLALVEKHLDDLVSSSGGSATLTAALERAGTVPEGLSLANLVLVLEAN